MHAQRYCVAASVAALLLIGIATTCFAAENNTNQTGRGPIRIQLHQREVAAPKLGGECFASHDDDEFKFPTNQSIYKLSLNSAGPPASCRHALKPRTYFTGTLQIGTPPQSFDMLIDTGSDVLWVPHTKCRLNGRLWASVEQGKFAIDRSKSFKRIGRERASMTYGNEMKFSGWWVEDRVRLADARDPTTRSLTVPSQALALICFIEGPEDPFEPKFDGIIGLSYPIPVARPRPTLMENLQSLGLLDEPVFSFYTNKAAKRAPQLSTGELILGQLDKSRYTGQITWANVVRMPHWEIRAHSIRMLEDRAPRRGPKSPAAVSCRHGCNVIVDTGTDCIFGPDAEVAHLNEQHLGFTRNQINTDMWFKMGACQQLIPKLPLSFVIQVGDTYLELKPEEFLQENETMEGAAVCVSALRSFGPKAGVLTPADWLLGSAFIQNFYTIFDYGQKRVGFATPV